MLTTVIRELQSSSVNTTIDLWTKGNQPVMRLIFYLLLPWALLIVIGVGPTVTYAQSLMDSRSLSVGGYYSKGQYGGEIDSSIRYFPFSAQTQSGNWRIQLTVPYLEIEGLGNVLVNVGGVTRAQRAEQVISSSGLGDIVISAAYQYDGFVDSSVFMDLVVETKLPSADEKKGLGTGELDSSVQLDIYKALQTTTLFGSLGFRHRGRSNVFAGLENSVYLQLGVQRPISDRVTTGLIYDFSEPASEFSAEIHEFLPYINWEFNENWSLLSYIVGGLTEDSPDIAAGMQFTYRW